jgi:hypothetical protein
MNAVYAWFALLGAAEFGSSLWLLIDAPLDGPISTYAGVPDYEAGRFLCWLPLALLGGFVWFLLNRLLSRTVASPSKSERAHALALAAKLVFACLIGFCVETLVSSCYWGSSYSRGIRAFYQSVWYWNRVPLPADLGWPSFKAYFLDHLIPWGAIFVPGFVVWLLWNKWRSDQASSPPRAAQS